jgi:hypothetical protein
MPEGAIQELPRILYFAGPKTRGLLRSPFGDLAITDPGEIDEQ